MRKIQLLLFILVSQILFFNNGCLGKTSIPSLVLWAWERNEDFTFMDNNSIAVAYLAQTFLLRGDKVIIKPRQQPMKVSKNTKLIAVFRIEIDAKEKIQLSKDKIDQIARSICAKSERSPQIEAIQIDLDAKLSERVLYAELLKDIRLHMKDNMSISITALSSWYTYDNWINKLPIDEVVPMFFTMGIDSDNIVNYKLWTIL